MQLKLNKNSEIYIIFALQTKHGNISTEFHPVSQLTENKYFRAFNLVLKLVWPAGQILSERSTLLLQNSKTNFGVEWIID